MDKKNRYQTPPLPIDSILDATARPEPTLSDREVVDRVLLGETALYAILVHRHNGRLYKFLRSILGSHDEVEDVMQEAHFRAMTHLNQFEGRSSFFTWLSRVMINEAYAHLRRRRVFQSLELKPETREKRQKEFTSAARNPEQHAIQRELREILVAAVDSLSRTIPIGLYGPRATESEHGGGGRASWRHRTMCEVSHVACSAALAEADLSRSSRPRAAHQPTR